MNAISEGFARLLPFWGPLTLLAQLALSVHVLRNGKPYWWILILLIFPVFGILIYLVAEVLPDFRRFGVGRGAGSPVWLPKSELVRRARRKLEDSETVEHRLELAEALSRASLADEAADVAAEAASGVFGDDPVILADVSGYLLDAGRADEASALITRSSAPDDSVTRARLALLKARVLLGTGRHPEARRALEELARTRRGEEPRFWLAVCQHEMGESDAAAQTLKDIVQSYRRGSRLWRRAEREWFQRSNRMLATLRAGKAERAAA